MKRKIKRRNRKRLVVERLVRQLAEFYGEATGAYLCPVCLDRLPGDDLERITDAHLIPEAAGGRALTILCVKCNGDFGARQDKWMGEYLQLIKEGHPFKAPTQARSFEVGGVRVNGAYRVKDDGSLEFLIRTDLNSKETLA